MLSPRRWIFRVTSGAIGMRSRRCSATFRGFGGEGCVLVVRDATALWRNAPRATGGLVESWLFCADDWARRGKPFHLVFAW